MKCTEIYNACLKIKKFACYLITFILRNFPVPNLTYFNNVDQLYYTILYLIGQSDFIKLSLENLCFTYLHSSPVEFLTS